MGVPGCSQGCHLDKGLGVGVEPQDLVAGGAVGETAAGDVEGVIVLGHCSLEHKNSHIRVRRRMKLIKVRYD